MFIGDAFDPSDSRAGRESRIAVIRDRHRIGAVREKKFHERQVAGLGCADERCCAGVKEPLHRKNGPAQGVVFCTSIRRSAMIKQNFDELEVIHVWFGYRKIAAFDISVICGQVKRCPCSVVCKVHIGATFDQIRSQFVMAVVGRY